MNPAFTIKKNHFIFACAFFFSLGSNILSLSLIYRLADWFSFSPGKIGAFVALGQVFYFLGCNLYHRFGSAFNPVKAFSASAVIIFLVLIPLGFTRTVGIVYISYWTFNLCTGFYWAPLMAWLTDGLGMEDLNREIGFYNRSWMAGNIFGPLISGALYQINSGAAFFVLCVCHFLVVVFLFFMHRYLRTIRSAAGSANPKGTSRPVGASRPVGPSRPWETAHENPEAAGTTDKRLDLYRYRGWISGLCSMMFVGVLVNIIPLHIRDGLGYTERSAGILLFLRSVMAFAGFAILARFTAWHFNRRWFLILQCGLLLCTILLILAGNRLFLYAVIVILYGFIYAACYNNSMFYSGATGMDSKKNLALHEIFLTIGNAVGTAGGGFFYQHFRFSGTCIALFLALGAGLGVFVLFNKKDNQKAT